MNAWITSWIAVLDVEDHGRKKELHSRNTSAGSYRAYTEFLAECADISLSIC